MGTKKSRKQANTKAAHSRRSDTSSQNGFIYTATSSLFGAMIGAIASFVLSLAGAFICFLSNDPNSFVFAAALAALFLSSIIAGFVSVRRRGSSALLCGALSGIFLMIFFLIVSLFFRSEAETVLKFPLSMLLRLSAVAVSILGGYLGVGRSNKKRRPKRMGK